MSHFEYIFTGILSPEYEEKTKQLVKEVNGLNVPFSIQNYSDEVINDDKKKRTLVLYSQFNMSDYLANKFINCGLEMRVYLKQQII